MKRSFMVVVVHRNDDGKSPELKHYKCDSTFTAAHAKALVPSELTLQLAARGGVSFDPVPKPTECMLIDLDQGRVARHFVRCDVKGSERWVEAND